MPSEPGGRDLPLYRRVMGEDFERLPSAVRAFHDTPATGHSWTGRADISRGKGWLVSLICSAFGMPRNGAGIPLTIEVEGNGHTETWTRWFGAHRMASTQGTALHDGRPHLLEKIGPMTAIIDLRPDGGRMNVVIVGSRFAGLPLPKHLCPTGDSHEYEENGQYRFHVEVRLPLVGRLITYRGFLEPVPYT